MREHGTRARYVLDRCRCQPCTTANRLYEANRQRQKAYGRWEPYVDASDVRAHLRRLHRRGLGDRGTSRAAGLARETVRNIRTGRVDRIRPETADRLLAVSLADVADGALVDATPAWTLVGELLAAGWRKGRIAQALGCSMPALQLGRAQITAGTLRAIQALHDREWRESAALRTVCRCIRTTA